MDDDYDELFGDDETAAAKKREQSAQEQFLADWRDVLATEQGRRVLNYIINYSTYHQNPFRGQSNTTIFNTGLQRVGQYVEDTARDVDRDLYLNLIGERDHARRSD